MSGPPVCCDSRWEIIRKREADISLKRERKKYIYINIKGRRESIEFILHRYPPILPSYPPSISYFFLCFSCTIVFPRLLFFWCVSAFSGSSITHTLVKSFFISTGMEINKKNFPKCPGCCCRESTHGGSNENMSIIITPPKKSGRKRSGQRD